MDKKPAFYEKQRFRQWWLWLLIVVTIAIPISIWMYMLVTGKSAGDGTAPDEVLLFPVIISLALIIVFARMVLITKIDDSGIYVKFSPFHRKWRHYPWDEVTGCEVKRFNPMMDYGGWGIKGNSYTVSGRMGVLVRFKDRYSQMIGTQKPEELKQALEQYGKLDPSPTN